MRSLRLGLLIVGVAIGACGRRPIMYHSQPTKTYDVQPSATCTDSSARALPPFRISDTLSLHPLGRNQRDAWLARRIPGGWAYGPWPSHGSNVGVMWVRDATQKRAVVAALDSLSIPNASYARGAIPDSVVAVDVRWDAAELYDWEYYLLRMPRHRPMPVRINGWAIDGRRGRIMFGVEQLETIPALGEWLREVGAPCHLIVAFQMGPVSALGMVAGQQLD